MWQPDLKLTPRVPPTPEQAPPSSQLDLAPTPAALNVVLDFQTPAVWGEITEKPPVGLGAKERRGANQPLGRLPVPSISPISTSAPTGEQCHLGRLGLRVPEWSWDKEGGECRGAVASGERDKGPDLGPLRLWGHSPGSCCVRLSSFWYLG